MEIAEDYKSKGSHIFSMDSSDKFGSHTLLCIWGLKTFKFYLKFLLYFIFKFY